RTKKDKIVDALASSLAKLTNDRQIHWIQGRGVFENANTLAVERASKVRFKNAIIATGSSPTSIPSLNLRSSLVMDSTTALTLESIPASLLVVGGGYIGLEMGTVYAALGSKVTVVELTGGLLPGVDPDLVRPLQLRLQNQFQKIHLNSK